MCLGIALMMGLATAVYADRCPVERSFSHTDVMTMGMIDSTDYRYDIMFKGDTATLNCDDDGGYKVYFENVDTAVVHFGLLFPHAKDFNEYGNFAADFEFSVSGGAPYFLVGVQGYTSEPHAEFSIVDYWTYDNADTSTFGTKLGEFTVDGDTYDIWHNTVNVQVLTNSASYEQYFSIRRNKRKSGHIDITAHFKKWEELGLKVGKIDEILALVEGSKAKNTSSSVYFKYFDITETAGSTGTTAISRRASLPLLKSDARVFDMQGRYLGTSEKKISPAIRTVKKR